MNGRLDLVRFLVEELGADVNDRGPMGFTPLYAAAERGHIAIVVCLVKELGAHVDLAAEDGATPLHHAAQVVHLTVVRILVKELDADVNFRTLKGSTALYAAAQNGHLDVVICLVKELGANADIAMLNGTTPLHMAAFYDGHLDVVQFLVDELGADVNRVAHNGRTALGFASAGNHKSIAAYLIKKGADPQASEHKYGTAADISRIVGAPAEQTAYLEAKMHCSYPSCSGGGIKKCTGCKQERYCGERCQLAHWPAHKADCKRWSAVVRERNWRYFTLFVECIICTYPSVREQEGVITIDSVTLVDH
jgi:ankyrin repeat protein